MPTPLKKKKPSVDFINERVKEYHELRLKKKSIDAQMKKLSGEIKKYAEDNGVKNSNGSYYCDNDTFIFGSQAKKSVTLDTERAIALFKYKELHKAIKHVEIINEEEVENYIASGQLTLEDIESVTNTTVTYAIDLKKKEEMTEVEQTTYIAASRKS